MERKVLQELFPEFHFSIAAWSKIMSVQDEGVTCDGAKEGWEILRTGKLENLASGWETHMGLVRVVFLLVTSYFSLLGVRERFSFPFHYSEWLWGDYWRGLCLGLCSLAGRSEQARFWTTVIVCASVEVPWTFSFKGLKDYLSLTSFFEVHCLSPLIFLNLRKTLQFKGAKAIITLLVLHLLRLFCMAGLAKCHPASNVAPILSVLFLRAMSGYSFHLQNHMFISRLSEAGTGSCREVQYRTTKSFKLKGTFGVIYSSSLLKAGPTYVW